MGSLLNFVFLSDVLEKNGDDLLSITGPLFWHIKSQEYSYTLNGEIRDGYKNLLMIEGRCSLDSFYSIPKDIINFILNNDVKLLAVSIADPTNIHTYNKVKRKLENILTNKFYILDSNTSFTDCFTIDYFIEEAVSENTKKNTFDVMNDLGYISEDIDIQELDNFRYKKFLCFNRSTDRVHRAALLHEYLTNDYSDSYFSFLTKLTNLHDIPTTGTISNNLYFYNKKLPIELDTQNTTNKTSFGVSSTFKKELFLNSCVHIVTETSFQNNELFLSEKGLKPIIMYQPFIVFGPSGYLKRLKIYGFKTFSDFWDESYDDIEDHRKRLDLLIKLVNELNKKSIEELNELYKKTKDICIYNRGIFDSLELNTFSKIFKQIENEW
jgi:hypothetical protein